MPTSSPLLIDLAGVARLADVQRPVASVWRTRFASAADPFPRALVTTGSRPLFDAMSVAQWLERTKHGNNPDAVADAAASAAPVGFDITDASHVAAVDALLALGAASGEPTGGHTIDGLQKRALSFDPDDSCLVTEVSISQQSWVEWADLLADAAYSPAQASQLLERRHAATTSSAGSAGPLTAEAEALLVALTGALTVERQAELVVSGSIAPSLVAELMSQVGDDIEMVVPPLSEGRGIRRRLLCDGLVPPATRSLSDGPRLDLMRLPLSNASTPTEMLRAVDELVLGMRDDDRGVVIAPASVLVETVTSSDGLARTDILRSGRVRAILKLPAGLVTPAPREPLGLWVLGRETGDVAIADRFTAVADLSDAALSTAARADLTSDVLAAMGSARDVRAHSFRFIRLVRTSSMLAARGALVAGRTAPRAEVQPPRDLPALFDQALIALGEDAPQPALASATGSTVEPASVDQLIALRHLRLLPGTRLMPEEFSQSGLVVVGAEDLDDPAHVGDRRVDPMAFATRHPSARLTLAGDVVFRTSPTAKAWVDPDGSKLVAYPARVLRINPADPGGLVPELVAADINHSPARSAAWRRWRLRRVGPRVARPLRAALFDLAARREALVRRITALDSYAELLSSGVVSGAVTLADDAADAAPAPQ